MAYKAAIKSLSRAERIVIRDMLRVFGKDPKCAQIARNFVHEQMLDLATHVRFLQELAACWLPVGNDLTLALDVYEKVCSRFSLDGPQIRGVPVQTAGRAIAYNSFKARLYSAFRAVGVLLTKANLELELRALAAQCAAQPARAAFHTASFFKGKPPVPISGMLVWCCFLNPKRDSNPYVPPRHTAEAIRNAYGLGETPTEEHVILTYMPPKNLTLRCPTVADANSYSFFRPAAIDQDHGWTEPMDKTKPEGIPQPEAVHESLNSHAPDLTFQVVPY